jgi:hypothetical protein
VKQLSAEKEEIIASSAIVRSTKSKDNNADYPMARIVRRAMIGIGYNPNNIPDVALVKDIIELYKAARIESRHEIRKLKRE